MEEKKRPTKVHCYECLSACNLQMHPHRKNGLMVGWIFLCEEHEPEGDGQFVEMLVVQHETETFDEPIEWPVPDWVETKSEEVAIP